MRRIRTDWLATISSATTAVLGLGADAMARPTDIPPPIERLASIREAYLASLATRDRVTVPDRDGTPLAQFNNFPNFPNFSNFPKFPNWRNS